MAVDSNVEFTKLSQISTQIEDMLTRQKNVLKGQLDIVNNLAKVLKEGDLDKLGKTKDFSKDLKEVSENLEDITEKKESLNFLGYAFERATKKTGYLNKKLRELEKKNLPAVTVAATAMIDGFKSGFGATDNLVRLLGRSLMTVGRILVGFTKSVITAPFKLLSSLIHMADQGGSNELAQALEDIRKQFGYLNKTAGGAVVQMARSMRGQLANTGLSVYRVFGNLAKRLQYFLEYGKNLGPVFDAVYRHIGEGGAEALGAFNKALGFTAEGQKAIASRSVATGRTVNAINREIANYAIQLSEQFGVTMKEVSRDVGNMMADFQHFGHLGVRELTQVATQARRLGIEVKALASLMDKWNNFDEAAEGAARLSQAFGLNVDALKLIQSQNPAERMEQLRKAFFRAGRSVETMTNQERRYLAQQTGLDDATVGLAFSLKNQALSYDQVTRKGAAAQKNQLTQAQALQRLTGAIERLVHAGGGDGLGFFDKFFKGFKIGIRRTHEFRRVMINLRRSLRQTLYAGIRVGRDFVRTFPGIRDYLRGLADLFNPRRFRVLLNSVKDAFHNFFLDMSRKDGTALPRLLDRLKHGFLDFFNRSTPAGQRTLSAFKQYLEAFTGIINGLLKNTLRGLTRIITEVTDVLSGRKTLQSYLSELGSTGGFLGKLFERLTRGLGPVANQLWLALKTLFETVWDKAKPYLVTAIRTYFITSISLSLVSAGMQGFIGGVGTRLGLILMRNMFFSSPVQRATTQGAQKAVQNAASAVQQAQQGASRAQQASTDVSGAVAGASRTSEAVQRSRTTGADIGKLLVIAAVMAVGIYAMVRGMFAVIQEIREKRITPQEIIMAAGVLGASTALVLASSLVVQAIGRMPTNVNPGRLIGGLINVFSVAGATILLGFGLVAGVRKYNFTSDEIRRANMLVLGASGLLLAASAAVGIVTAAGSLSQGNPTAIIAGLLGLIGVLGVMIVGAMGILHVTRNFNVQQVENAKKIMDAVGSLFVRASVVLGVATIAGALAAFSGGTSALALAAGMAMIASVVTLMVTQSLAIINQVNRLNLGSGFEQKLNAFIRVVQTISGFVNPLISSLTALNPGFFSSALTRLFGGNPEAELQNTFSSLTGVIQTIGREVSRLLKSVSDSLTSIRTVPESTISTYATVIGSVASLASALVPQLQNLRTSASDTVFGDSTAMTQKLEELRLYVSRVTLAVSELLVIVGRQARSFEGTNFTQESLNGARIFVGVLKAVGDLAKSLVPSPEFIRATSEAASRTRSGGWVDGLGRFVNQITNSLITSGLLDRVRDFVQQLGTYFSSFNRTQLNSLQTSSRIIEPLFGLVRSIVELIRSNSRQQTQEGTASLSGLAANLLGFEGQMAFVNRFFETIREQVPLLLTTIGNIQLNRSQVSAIQTNLNLVKNLIEVTKQVTDLSTSIGSASQSRGNNSVTMLRGTFFSLRQVAGSISDQGFVDSLNGISRININSRAITANLSSVNRVVTKMGEVTQSLTNIQASMQSAQAIAESMKGNSVRSVTTAIVEMVNTINEVSHEMAKATQNLPNVNVSLRRMADGLGMAGNNSIEIRRRDVVISVPVTVTLKGEELQTTLISVANNTPTGRPRLGVNAGA